MKTKYILAFTCAVALGTMLGQTHAAQLVTNGDFENLALGGTPPGWNTTFVGAGSTGVFYPGGPPGYPQSPLSGSVGYMTYDDSVIQIFQTFTTIKLQPATIYTISFDAYISVGSGVAYLLTALSHGTGSGATSAYSADIAVTDLVIGPTGFYSALTTTGQNFTHFFTTKSIEEGFAGSASDLAIYMQTSVGFGDNAAQAYFDNVSVTTTPIPEPSAALLGGLGLLGLLRRRR